MKMNQSFLGKVGLLVLLVLFTGAQLFAWEVTYSRRTCPRFFR